MERIEEKPDQNNELKLKEQTIPMPELGTVRDSKSFRIQAKTIGLTYSKCELPVEHALKAIKEKLELEYIIVAQEYHKDGSLHLHALIIAKHKVRISDQRYFDINGFHPNILVPRNVDDWLGYVKKNNKFVEDGYYHGTSQSAVQKRAAHNKLVMSTNIHVLLDEGIIHAAHTKQYRDAKQIYEIDKCQSDLSLVIKRKYYWIYGNPSSGKTWLAYHKFTDNPKDVYTKDLKHEYWSGYLNQSVVVLDDFSHDHAIVHQSSIKHWAQDYLFQANVKGSYIYPTYTTLVVTSNYLPEHLWPDTINHNQETLRWAISRRFEFFKVVNRELVPMTDRPKYGQSGVQDS